MLIGTTTIAVDFVSKTFQLSDGSIVNCFIYDTAGQEKFNSINETYYKKADAVLLVYDVTNRLSFDLVKEYYSKKIKELCKKNIPIILLGNKTDKVKERKVQQEEGVKLAFAHKYKFKETSCLKNENVSDSFEALIEMWNLEELKKTKRNENFEIIEKDSEKITENIKGEDKDKNDENSKQKTITITIENNLKEKKKGSKCCLSFKKN